MSEPATIARPYAEAAFAVARDALTLDAWATALDELAQVVAVPAARDALANPALPPEARASIMTGFLRAGLPAGMQPLLALIVENDRIELLPEINTQFAQLKAKHEGTAGAIIESAFPIADADLEALLLALSRRFPVRLVPTVIVDPSLLGGVRVTVGDQVLDATVRARLDAMKTALAAA